MIATDSPSSIEAAGLSPRKAEGAGAVSVITAMIVKIHSSTGTLRKPST